MLRFDLLAIPADAPNPDAAHAFIDFLLRPENLTELAAGVAGAAGRPEANAAATGLARPESPESPTDPASPADPESPPATDPLARLFPQPVASARDDRTLARFWTAVRTGR